MFLSKVAQDWAERLDRFNQAELTVAQFCHQEAVSQASFYKWRQRLRANDPAKQEIKLIKQPQFVPVTLPNSLALVPPTRTMILCDGGYNPGELKAVVDIAKPGAIVLAHDYAPNRQVFNTKIRGKRWNRCEITDADLPATGIRPIKSQMLRDAMWFCGVVQDG